MCGILAYYNRNGISQEQFSQSLSALKKIKHRGPDGEGVLIVNTQTGEFRYVITDGTPSGNFPNSISIADVSKTKFDLLLGHRRLSIIDLSNNGHQPMADNNGNVIVFNGEIYNYIELRDELKKLNHVFNTDSDTEVILKAYTQWGADCLKKFNGMFSIVLFDKLKSELLIANDRFGVKPLNYFHSDSELICSSEIRQIKEFKRGLTINDETVNNFLAHAYLDYGQDTFYKEVQRFPAAHYAKFNLRQGQNEIKPVLYYSISETNTISQNPVEQFKELFTDAVKLRLRSDVPVGFASSGGLDSSSVLYTAHHLLSQKQTKPDLSTFSAIYPGLDGDESEFISIIEKDLNIKSNYINPLNEFNIEDFENHIYHQEYPVQSTSYYAEWCVARMVNRENVKVLLIGQGGDEILAGYHHHFYRYCRQLILQGSFIKYFSLLKKYSELKGVQSDSIHQKIIGEVKLSLKLRTGLSGMGNSLNKKWNKADKLIELLKLDLKEFTLPTYLRSDDRDSMAFSLETRHPFLDYRLVDFCFSLPNEYKIKDGWQKWILREAMPQMPIAIRYRKDKKGYTTPQDIWINRNKPAFESYLSHLPKEYSSKNSNNLFLKYALGAWFKSNK